MPNNVTTSGSPSEFDVDVAIAGAGVGGLAAAIALQRAGITADVYEQARELGEAGGSLTLDTPALDVLRDWDLADEFLGLAVHCDGLENRSISGEFLNHFQLPDLTAMGVEVEGRTGIREIFAILRADLQLMLLRQIPAAHVHLRKKLRSAADRGTHAEAVFEDGTTVRARVLIGADGIQSVVRKLFSEVDAQRSDVTICRSLASADQLPADLPNDR